jgi:micrococcal nuclease
MMSGFTAHAVSPLLGGAGHAPPGPSTAETRRRQRAGRLAAAAAAAAAALALLAAATPATAQPHEARAARIVKRVVDGDTLVLLGGERVRLLGLDAPELDSPDARTARLAREAAAFARGLAERRHVYLQLDRRHRDRHGRTLAYVFLADGRLLNAELVKRGHARAYTRFPFMRRAQFQRLEREARKERRGMWAERR